MHQCKPEETEKPRTSNRSEAVATAPDGSLDIYLQATSPGKDKESNCLPTPPGQFNLTLRNYFPKRAAYDGSYKVPPVKKVS